MTSDASSSTATTQAGPRAGPGALERTLRRMGHGVFSALATFALLFCLQVVRGVFERVDRPFVGFTMTEEGFVNPVSLGVWGAEQAGLRRWDRVVSVDQQPAPSPAAVMSRALRHGAGYEVTYEVEGLEGQARVVRIPTRTFMPSDIVRSHAGQALLGLVFVLIAILLYLLRPGTAEAWSFFAFFASLGLAMASVVDLTFLWKLPPIYPYIGPFLAVFGLLLVGILSGAYLRAFHLGPGARWLRRGMFGVTVLSLAVAAALSTALYLTQGDMRRYLVFDELMYAWIALATLTGVLTLTISYRRSRSVRRRTRLRQMLWSWPVGAGIPTLNLFLGHVLEVEGFSLIWNAFLVLVPLATADAIVRHDLLDLSNRARKLIGGVTVAAVMGIGLGFGMWAAAEFLNLNDAAGMVALAALLFAIAAPLTHRVQRYVDQLLRSSPYDAGRLLADFTARASTAMHLHEVTALLRKTLDASVRPEAFELYRLDRNEALLLPEAGHGRRAPVTPSLSELLERAEPALFDDEEPAPPELPRASIALRLAVANEPIGLFWLAARPDGRPYEAGDVAFVSSLAGPLAAALTNARSYEEVETLNLELEGRVQERTRELREANAELARMNSRKDELVATISHDFRSPLAIIRQNVQTILRDLQGMDPDDLMHFLEGVARQEARLTSMCTNLLDLARLKQSRAFDDPVDMAALTRGMVEEFGHRAEEAGIALSLAQDDDAPVAICGDAERLSQVLQNLLDNALKFTGAGGEVRVFLAAGKDEHAQMLELRIDDTGCGVPSDALPRLFEPFYQVPRESHVGQGSGLGLAIAKAVVDAHQGALRLESEEGSGTRCRVWLPAQRGDGPALPAPYEKGMWQAGSSSEATMASKGSAP